MKYDAFVDQDRSYSSAQIWNNILGTFQTGGHRVEEAWNPNPGAEMVISYDIKIPDEKIQEFHGRTGIILKPRL